MKILLCLHHFLPEFVGGTEIYTLQLALHLKQQGIEPVILIPHFDHSTTSEYIYQGIRVIRYAEASVEDRSMIMGKKEPDGLTAFAAVLINEQPAIIHFHELAPGRGINIFHVEKAHELSFPIVLTFHLSYYTCIKGSLVYKDEQKCGGEIRIKSCTECIYQSKNITGVKAKLLSATALSLYKIGIDPTVINSSTGTALGFPFIISKIRKELMQLSALAEKIIVLAEWYKNVLQKNNITPDKLLFLKQALPGEIPHIACAEKITLPLKVVYMGRISKLKGLHLLIEAINSLPEDKILLHIYGPETEDSYVVGCKQNSETKENIRWMGSIPSQEVISTLANYHVLCLPSDFEMSPLIIREAFAAGLPVIASDVYGNAEQISEGVNGWLFRFRDSKDLAEKLTYLIQDLDNVTRAKSQLPGSGSFAEVARKHAELYTSIVSKQKQLS